MGFKMTDILPPAGWPNVRQLETNEFATGGANGNMNEQAKSLAARTELLKNYTPLPYESGKSYKLNERVQLATGDIVRSTIPGNVNNPNVDMTGWEVPSLKTADNLSDVPNKATARSNLSVYSQAQVDNAIANATPTIPDATETTAGKAKIATTAIAQAGVNDTDFLTAKKLRDALNATGDAPISACRARINFDGATGVMLGGFNIASITRNSLGDYTVTLASAMPDTNYSLLFGGIEHPNGTPLLLSLRVNSSGVPLLKTTTSFRISLKAQASNTYFDAVNLSVGVFG